MAPFMTSTIDNSLWEMFTNAIVNPNSDEGKVLWSEEVKATMK